MLAEKYYSLDAGFVNRSSDVQCIQLWSTRCEANEAFLRYLTNTNKDLGTSSVKQYSIAKFLYFKLFNTIVAYFFVIGFYSELQGFQTWQLQLE